MAAFRWPCVLFVALGLFCGCDRGSISLEGLPRLPSEAQPADLELTLRADRATYSLAEAEGGNVTLVARFRNLGDRSVLLAHPNVVLAKKLQQGESWTLDHERARMSIRIESPQGATFRFRQNLLRRFEPHGRDHLLIAPGAAGQIALGWLGPYFTLGQWQGIDRPIFSSRGTYRISLTYENTLPVALIAGADGKPTYVDPWIGTIESNTVTVRIE